ncbi:MAG: hypothetical protein KJP21_02615, partial [Bacteroidia bacterium]|nr:hypothetical protein [Bacteroidia bacterium]
MKRPINLLVFTLFASALCAQTWTKLNLPSTDQNFTDIKYGQDGNLYLLTTQGLYKSTDNGDNWSVYDAGCRNSDSKVGDELMTITKDGLVFIDKALTINQTNGSELKRTEYYTLGGYQRSAQMVSLSTGEIIMAHRDNWGPNNVDYKISTDGGATFTDKKTSASFALKNYKHPIMFVNDNDDIYYVNADKTLHRSTDKGESYTSSGTEFNYEENLCALDRKTGIFYGVGKNGLYWNLKKSADHGATWTDITLPSNNSITSISVNDGNIILSTNYYCTYSDDGGATWTEKTSMFETSRYPEKYVYTSTGEVLGMNVGEYGVALIDFSTGTITPKVNGIDHGYSSTHFYNGSRLDATFSGYAYYTDDKGMNWTKLKGAGAHCGGIWVASDNTVYTSSTAIGTWNGVYVQDNNDSMVAVTADVGSVWNMSQNNAMFEDDQGNIYCASNSHGLYKSSDGMSFVRQSEAPFNSGLEEQTLWFDKGSKRMFGFISLGGDLHYSDDYGVTWTDGTKITDQGYPQFMQFPGGNKVWTYMWSTNTATNGFYSSSDMNTWTGPAKTTANFDNRYDQFIKGNKESQIFLASTRGYVRVSNDTGKTWTEYESGLDSFEIIDRTDAVSKFVPVVKITSGGNHMVLSTTGSVYMIDMDGGSSGSVASSLGLDLVVYPNPAEKNIHVKTRERVLE